MGLLASGPLRSELALMSHLGRNRACRREWILPLDLFIVQLIAMSISFFVHLYFDKHYHVTGSWLGRFAWFRRKQQLHFLHHRYADCNFAVVDNFWDWLLGTYRSIGVDGET